MLTIDGDMVSKLGAMSGGFRKSNKNLNILKDKKELNSIKEIETKNKMLKESIELLEDEIEEKSLSIFEKRNDKSYLEGEILKLEQVLSINQGETLTITKENEQLDNDKKILEKEILLNKKDEEEINQKIEKIKKEKEDYMSKNNSKIDTLNKREVLQNEKLKITQMLNEVIAKIKENDMQIEHVIKKDIEKIK